MNGTWVKRPKGNLTVVFIHGVLSSGDSCWRHANGAYWPDILAREPSLTSVGIYVFEYKTSFFSGAYRLGDVVDDLSNRMRLDEVEKSKQLVFVCHSMGGIVARRFIVQKQFNLSKRGAEIGLFLIASPSLGSQYANWLQPLARAVKHTQAEALRFSQANSWLLDLDKDFLNLKESRQIPLRGKELVEDTFVTLRLLNIFPQVVEPFSGAKYFGDAYKVPNSDHFSIAKVADKNAIQHRLLIEFIRANNAPTAEDDNLTAVPSSELLEQAVCGKAEAEFLIAIREFNNAPKSREHIAEINANIKREAFQRQSVFSRSLQIEIEYYLLPLIKKLIQIETEIRIQRHLPFTENRIETLREMLRNLVLDSRSNIAWNAYRDSIEHVVLHCGHVFEYIEEELKHNRIKREEQIPDGIFTHVDELLQKAFADSKFSAT